MFYLLPRDITAISLTGLLALFCGIPHSVPRSLETQVRLQYFISQIQPIYNSEMAVADPDIRWLKVPVINMNKGSNSVRYDNTVPLLPICQ